MKLDRPEDLVPSLADGQLESVGWEGGGQDLVVVLVPAGVSVDDSTRLRVRFVWATHVKVVRELDKYAQLPFSFVGAVEANKNGSGVTVDIDFPDQGFVRLNCTEIHVESLP